MLEIAARSAQILIALGGAYLLALWFVLIVWTYRDIEARSNSVFTQIFSTLLVVLFFIPGIVLYLLLRPKETLDDAFQKSLEEEYLLQDIESLVACPSCKRAIDPEYMICPHCQERLREPCVNCGKLLDKKWPVCPYCATPQRENLELNGKVEPPAPRFIAPGQKRKRVEAASEPTRIAPAATAVPTMQQPVDAPRINMVNAVPDQAAAAEPARPTVVPPAVAPMPAPQTPPPSSGLRPLDRFRPKAPRDDKSTVSGTEQRASTSDLLRSLEPSSTTQPIAATNPDYSRPVFPGDTGPARPAPSSPGMSGPEPYRGGPTGSGAGTGPGSGPGPR